MRPPPSHLVSDLGSLIFIVPIHYGKANDGNGNQDAILVEWAMKVEKKGIMGFRAACQSRGGSMNWGHPIDMRTTLSSSRGFLGMVPVQGPSPLKISSYV